MKAHVCVLTAAVFLGACEGARTPVQPTVLQPIPQAQPSPFPEFTPVLVGAAEYAITITADPMCNLPDVARRRSFTAQVFVDTWDGYLIGKITGATIRSTDGYDFWLSSESRTTQQFYIGNYMENFGIMEEIAQGLVLLFGEATIAPNGSKMSGALAGKVGFCAGPVKSGLTPAEACRNPPVICESGKHQIDLERR